GDLRSWSAAWWRPRWRWGRRCLLPSARGSLISTGRSCWRATGRTGFATTAAAFTRRRRRCGDETERPSARAGAELDFTRRPKKPPCKQHEETKDEWPCAASNSSRLAACCEPCY